MRKTIFISFIIAGSVFGALVGSQGGIGVAFLFGGLCAEVGAIFGGVIACIGNTSASSDSFDRPNKLDDFQKDLSDNYWRDRGRSTISPGMPNIDELDTHSPDFIGRV